jgi:lipopolysaccharide biosynthesis glycosyltransferase
MNKLICTNTYGNYEAVRSTVYPIFKRYAKKVKADFIAIEDSLFPNDPILDKFRIGEFLNTYDRLIYFDADLVIRSDLPDLFKIVPQNRFGAYDESSSFGFRANFPSYGEAAMFERIYHMIRLCKLWNLEIPPVVLGDADQFSYFNTGVYVCSKEHLPIFKTDASYVPLDIELPEQSYVNWGILTKNILMHHLPACFNQMTHNRVKDYLECSYVIHFAGLTTVDVRLPMMQAVLGHWKEIGY